MCTSDHTTPLKRCTKCGQEFPATSAYFSKKSGRKSGLNERCRACNTEEARKWRRANPEKTRERTRNYKKRKPEIIKANGRRFRERHREVIKQRSKDYRKRHREQARAKAREWEENNRLRVRELKRLGEQRRRARKKAIPFAFTDEHWQRALDYFDHRCAVCGRPTGLWHKLVMDHWIPLSDPSCPGTVPENIVPLCHGQGGCNNIKKHRDPAVWLVEQYGPRRARQIEARIQAYFRSLATDHIE